jgi:hypothetical protein
MQSLVEPTSASAQEVFRISPLVSYTLYGLLLALVLPLPFLMIHQQHTDGLVWAGVGTLSGFVALVGIMSQRVCIDDWGISVRYAAWVPSVLVQGWSLPWPEVKALHSRPTSQGGRAHYIVSADNKAYLLPMRIAGFAKFLRSIEAYSTLDTSTIKPLAQPWMYLMLLICVVLMMLIDIPFIFMALQ